MSKKIDGLLHGKGWGQTQAEALKQIKKAAGVGKKDKGYVSPGGFIHVKPGHPHDPTGKDKRGGR